MQLLPKDEKFFDLFVEQAAIFQNAAKAVNGATGSGQGFERDAVDRIGKVEKEGDDKYREILERLNRTFITPIDPEDIGQVASAVEGLTDQMEALAFRISACNVIPLPSPVAGMTKQFEESAALIGELFDKLQRKQMDAKDEIREDCAKIRHNIGAVVCQVRDSLRELYRNEQEPLALIKSKDIYEAMDTTARRFQHFTDVIQNVVAKNT